MVKFKIPLVPLFSMSCLLCLIWYSKTGIRKDHIIFLFYLIYIILLRRTSNQSRNIIVDLVLNIIFVVIILIHEIAFIFFCGPIFIFICTKNQWAFDRNILVRCIRLLLVPLITFLYCITHPGNAVMEIQIIESWEKLGVKKLVFWTGVFKEPYFIWRFFTDKINYIILVAVFLFHFIFFLFSTKVKVSDKGAVKMFQLVLSLQFLLAIILTIVASDYARWIVFASFTSVFFIFINMGLFLTNENRKSNKYEYIYIVQYYLLTIPFSTEENILDYFNFLPFISFFN